MTGNRIQRHSSNSVSIIQLGSLKPRERTAQDGPRPWKALALLPFWSNIFILQNEPALGKNWYPTTNPLKKSSSRSNSYPEPKDGRWFFNRLLLVAGICFGRPNSFRPRCSKTYEGRPLLSLTIGEKRNCSPTLLDENEGKENIETKRREIRVRLKVIIESFNRISLISIFAKIEWHIG